MNRKKWICTAAAITGLLLAVIAGLSIRHMKNSSYVSASELAGQKSGSVSEKLEENRNEDLAESSESKNGQPDGKQDQENGAGAEKNENGGNSSAGQNTDEEAAENQYCQAVKSGSAVYLHRAYGYEAGAGLPHGAGGRCAG